MAYAQRAHTGFLQSEANLFSHFNVPLLDDCSLYLVSASRDKNEKIPRHLTLVCADESVVSLFRLERDWQLHLEFMDCDETNLIRFVPRTRYVYLSHGTYDVFRDHPKLVRPAAKLAELGYHDLGRLVQLSETQLAAFSFIKPDHIEAMKTILAGVDLTFGMKVIGWPSALPR